MRWPALFLSLALFALPALATAATPTPVDVVTAFYRLCAGPKGDYNAPILLEGPAAGAYFTTALRKALRANRDWETRHDSPNLDFDPVTDSQDPLVEHLVIAAESAAEVRVTFNSGLDAHVLHYDMKPEGGGWKIDNIRGGAGADGWDLRHILENPQ